MASPEHADADSWLIAATREIAVHDRTPERDSDVERLISSISTGLRHIRRPGRTLDTDRPGLHVNDRVIKQHIAIGLRRRIGRLVVSASIDGEGAHVDAVRVALIARYADDLLELSETVRDVVAEILVETLGPVSSDAACKSIGVDWRDVYTREWLV